MGYIICPWNWLEAHCWTHRKYQNLVLKYNSKFILLPSFPVSKWSLIFAVVYYFSLHFKYEEHVSRNLIILNGAVVALVESHALNWLQSCSINLSKMPRVWFHLISDRVKTINVNSREITVRAAQRGIVFITWLDLLELACGQLGMVKLFWWSL